MPDIQLGQLRNGGDGDDIVKGQAMARMRLYAIFPRQRGGVGQPFQLRLASAFRQMRVSAGVELHHRRTQTNGGVNLSRIRLDEQADADASVFEARYDGVEVIMPARRVQPAFGGPLFALFRDDAGRVRFVPQRDFQHFLGRGHFQIQRQIGCRHDPRNIRIANMPPVFAQMRGDAVCAARRHHFRRPHRIRMLPAARIADRRHMVDIHA